MQQLFLKYWAWQLTLRNEDTGVSSLALALSDMQIDLLPHQITAVNRALKSLREYNGVILADEVGLGKTIEAGIVICQHWQQGKRKILVIVPASLLEQWSRELEEKFKLPVAIVNSRYLRRKNPPNPFISNKIVLCSYHFASNKAKYLSGLPWDLCCIDEAHNLRNPHGRMATALRNALRDVPKLLITATPIQNSMKDLRALTELIDEYLPTDSKKNSSEPWTPLLVRTLRKDSGVNFVNRIAVTYNFKLNAAEQRLYARMEEFLRQDNLHCLNVGNRQLLKMTLRRLLASCPSNLAETLKRLAERLRELASPSAFTPDLNTSAEELKEMEKILLKPKHYRRNLTSVELEELRHEAEELRELHQLASQTHSAGKSQSLILALEERLKHSGKRKVVVFTEFLQAQQFLFNLLQSIPAFKGRVVMINGDNLNPQAKAIYSDWEEKFQTSKRLKHNPNLDRKTAILDYFQHKADILIATDAASEGLNLQFCSMVVNYDLPWNPQRLEQRIGRCHRYGQKNDVVVVNFLNLDNLAEKRLLEILTGKLKLFNRELGSSNSTLGEQTQEGKLFERQIGEIFLQCRTPEEINQAFNRIEQTPAKLDDSWGPAKYLFCNSIPELNADIEKQRRKLWEICKSVYGKFGTFSDKTMTFFIPEELEHERIRLKPGKYSLLPHSKRRGYRTLNQQHPIVQCALDECRNFSNSHARATIPPGILPGTTGFLQVSVIKCRCHYEYEKLVYTGYSDAAEALLEHDCIQMLECARIAPGRPGKADEKHLEQLEAQRMAEEQTHLQETFDRYITDFETRLNQWEKEKLAEYRNRLTSLTRTPRTELEFDCQWEQYRNEQEMLAQKKELILMQVRRDYAPALEVQELFTLQWNVN